MRNLKPAGKLQELTHEMYRYHWNILGLCEMRWRNFGELSSDDRHKFYFCGEEERHEFRFLVHKDMMSAVLDYRPSPAD